METLSQTPRVVFGAESDTAGLLVALGATRVVIVAAARHDDGARRIADALGERFAGSFLTDGAQVPADVAARAVDVARAAGADWVLAHGGGTPIGVAKAVALESPVKIAAVPTTYAGSERTDIWGITREGRKLTGRDPRVLPSLVVYDPALTLALPRELSLQSLLNALAHAVEALYAAEATGDARASARAALGPLMAGMEGIARDPADPDARAAALRGAALASAALGGAAMGLHHKLAHVLGGSFGTAHAATHATLLPYTFGFNAPFAPAALDAAFQAWNTRDPGAFLYDRMRAFGLATSARTLGLTDAQLPLIADEVLAARYPNPREVDRDGLLALLDDALHDRRPSLGNRRLAPPAAEGPHATMGPVHRGAQLDRAKAVILALHGRGASAERFAADLERRLGPNPDVAIVAPQARNNTWYPKGFLAPIADNQPWFDSALSTVEALWRDLEAQVGADRIVPVGFSQGACLLLTWLSTTPARPRRALAFTGAPTPVPDASFAAAKGLRLHLGASAGDPWVDRATVEAAVARFRAAGAEVDATLVPGDVHGIHAPDDEALRRAVAAALAADDLLYQDGLGGHATEARAGALPRGQNSPRIAPYGLVAEQINGTPFTTRRADNQRTWMYRLRPQILATGFQPRPHERFVGDYSGGVPTPEVLGFKPVAVPDAPTDFLAGLSTFAGVGDPSLGRGAAVHSYAANRDMGRVALCDVDGDLLFVPERGRLHLRTELGRMLVSPGEVAVIPRGLRFSVSLPDGVARGWMGELYDGHFRLPERGVVGANGLADERHFQVPVADFDDDPQPWTIVVRQGGQLWQVEAPHGPFDVVAWHGNYTPYKYALDRFVSLGSVSVDHPDPSILTVLTAPIEGGRSAFDVGVFRGRFDVSQGTFRPAFFHRNAAVEFNGVIRSPAGSRFAPGAVLYTPLLTPHGVSARTYAHQLGLSDAQADRPERIPDDSLWIQFESVYAMKVMPWRIAERDPDHLGSFAGYPPPGPT